MLRVYGHRRWRRFPRQVSARCVTSFPAFLKILSISSYISVLRKHTARCFLSLVDSFCLSLSVGLYPSLCLSYALSFSLCLSLTLSLRRSLSLLLFFCQWPAMMFVNKHWSVSFHTPLPLTFPQALPHKQPIFTDDLWQTGIHLCKFQFFYLTSGPRHTYHLVVIHTWTSHVTTAHTPVGHGTHVNEPCHTRSK